MTTQLASDPRYARTLEVMTIRRTLLAGAAIDHHGEFYDVTLEAPRIAVDRAAVGYRTHIVVRETESEARAAANRLLSQLDAAEGEAIRNRSLDTTSTGVSRQAELRDSSDDDGFIEEHLWTGIARARSGCGAAIVGDPDQVVTKLRAYTALGIDTFILSGYPHLAECDLVAKYVLPGL